MKTLKIYIDSCFAYYFEPGKNLLLRKVKSVFLGEDLTKHEELMEKNIPAAIQSISEELPEDRQCKTVIYAGEPFRRAKNGMEFIHSLREVNPDFEFKNLSIKDEIGFLLKALNEALLPKGDTGIIYFNGDRAFFIFLENGSIVFAFAPPLGIQAMRDLRRFSDPPEREEILFLRNHIARQLDNCYFGRSEIQWFTTGTLPASYFHLLNSVPNEEMITEPIPASSIRKSAVSLTSAFSTDLERLTGVKQEFVFAVPYISVLFEHIIDYFKIKDLKLAEVDILDGIEE